MSSAVDLYLGALPSPWPRQTAEAVIATIRRSGAPDESLPNESVLDESMKWRQPYFSLHGRAVVKLFTAKDWIDVFFYRGAELADPDGLLGAEGRSSMRRLQILRDHAVPGGLQSLVRQAIALAEAN